MSVSTECKKKSNLNKAIYKWSIPNFCFGCKKVGEKLSSPVFQIENTSWMLELYPRGVNEKFAQYTSLFLRLESGQQHVASNKFRLSILDCDEKNYAVHEGEYRTESSMACGKSDFIKQTDIKRNKSLLLPNDTLTICCEFSSEFANEEKQSEDCGKKRSRWESDKANDNAHEMYFDNKQYSDVKFISRDNKCVNAHKMLLINKSEVFTNLFSVDVSVLSPDIVYVKGIDYEVLCELFRFIYTDEVKDIEEYAVKLLHSADRFMLDDLKVLCEKYLSNNVFVENAVALLLLAEDYDLSRSKDEVKHFIALNVSDFIDLPDFQELTRYYCRRDRSTFC